jgi:predicted GNAT family acetyltransferase
MTISTQNEPDRSRYTLWVDGENAGVLDYQLKDSSIIFTRTEVEPQQRHRGLAGTLVQAALDDVRVNSDSQVVPQCPFVAQWIDHHPDYQELVDRG